MKPVILLCVDQIGPDVARLHVNGGVVGERKVDCFKSKGDGGDPVALLLAGGEGSLDGNCVQGYAHHVRVLPQPTVTNHYVKVGHQLHLI